MTSTHQRIFLVEFIVDNIHYNVIPKDKPLGRSCISFQFLRYPPMEICEDDFCPNAPNMEKKDITFLSGKSCLFSLRGPTTHSFETPFNFTVVVKRNILNDPQNRYETIGGAVIEFGRSFVELVNRSNSCPDPNTKSVRGTYNLTNESGQVVGSIVLLLRLSCFGPAIITQFQAGTDGDVSYLFKGGESQGKPCARVDTAELIHHKIFAAQGGGLESTTSMQADKAGPSGLEKVSQGSLKVSQPSQQGGYESEQVLKGLKSNTEMSIKTESHECKGGSSCDCNEMETLVGEKDINFEVNGVSLRIKIVR